VTELIPEAQTTAGAADQGPAREFIDGATAIVRGALAAGCDFFAGYPITPASSILMGMLDALPRRGGVAIQAEDEIASIGICVGAVMSGARAMTATSGPGLSLFSETLGLAQMGEVPLVIVDVQRMGPSTGAATTTAQGDVQFARWGTGGGYPLIVLAPSCVADSFTLTMRAFDLAERFRTPVILLTDKELALTRTTVDASAFVPVEVRPRLRPKTIGKDTDYYRYEPADGVAPVRQFGDGEVVRFTGSTHDQSAFITKDPATVGALNRHLAAKIDDHRDEIEIVLSDPQDGAGTLFVSYGSTAGAMVKAVNMARAAGKCVSALTVQSLWPVPENALREAMAPVSRVVVAELNLGQYRREVERLADGREVIGLHRLDGRLLAPEQFVELIQ